MPSKNKAQHNLMAMVAHDPAAAKRLGIPQSVGKEFVNADKGRKFSEGGRIMAKQGSGNGITKAKMGSVRTAAPSRDGIAAKGKTKGKEVKMTGSKPLGMKKGGKACY